MCPRAPIQSRQSISENPPTEYYDWVATARCIHAILYQHRLDKHNIICESCYRNFPTRVSEQYNKKNRHYINIGAIHNPEKCVLCRVSLVSVRVIRECGTCPVDLTFFLEFLERENSMVHADPNPTILTISEETA